MLFVCVCMCLCVLFRLLLALLHPQKKKGEKKKKEGVCVAGIAVSEIFLLIRQVLAHRRLITEQLCPLRPARLPVWGKCVKYKQGWSLYVSVT